MSDLPRVFFDTNDGNWEYGYWLDFPKSKAELAQIEGGPREGMRVQIYMPGELEVEAILKWDRTIWVGMPVEGTLRYLDGTR